MEGINRTASPHPCFPCPRPSLRLFHSLVEFQWLDPQLAVDGSFSVVRNYYPAKP